MSALSLATRGLIRPCCGGEVPVTKYTGFIRKEEEIVKPKIDIIKVTMKGKEGRPLREHDSFMKIKVDEARFVNRINKENNEKDWRY